MSRRQGGSVWVRGLEVVVFNQNVRDLEMCLLSVSYLQISRMNL